MNKLYSYFLLFLLVPALQAKKPEPSYFSYNEKKNGVIVDVQELSPKKADKRLGYGFKGRQKADSIIPLKCRVTNDSNRTIRFSKNDISLDLISQKLIKNKVEAKSSKYFWGGGMGGLLLFLTSPWIAWIVTMLTVGLEGGMAIAAAFFLPFIAMGALTISFVGFGLSDYLQKKARLKILNPYESLGAMELEPGESVEFNLYTRKKALASPFSMTVHDVGNQQKTQFMVAA